MLKNQLFGIEVEMTGITRKKAAAIVAEVLGTTSSTPDSTCYKTRIIADHAARKWKIMRDSSITPIRNDGGNASMDEYRVEFVTPPLGYEDIELLQNIIRQLRENGAKSHSSCGIHIHVDGANHNPNSLRRLVNFMTSRQDLIYEALEIGNRADRWCHKLNSALLVEMKKDKNLSKEKAEQIWYSSAKYLFAKILSWWIFACPAIVFVRCCFGSAVLGPILRVRSVCLIWSMPMIIWSTLQT